MIKKILAGATAAVAAFALSGCGEPGTDATRSAQKARTEAVENIRANQPVEKMSYSPTLDTINGWVKVWNDPSAVSYVYMKRADGTLDGYYVLKGLPVNYCVSGSPTYDWVDIPGDGSGANTQVPAPALDGAYYGGCDASRYYGFDAVTGQYLEYTDGFIMTAQLSNQPLPLDKQPPAYISSIEDVARNK